VAALVQRAGNAKSPRDRHGAALRAWGVSARLRLADRLPEGLAAWTADPLTALGDLPEVRTPLHGVPAFHELQAFLTRRDREDAPPGETSATAAQLFHALAAYRERARWEGQEPGSESLDRATSVLLAGHASAWDAGLFGTGRFLYREASCGAMAGRLLELRGEAAEPLPLEEDRARALEPGRVYREQDGTVLSLHPWVLYRTDNRREQVLFFTGTAASARYSDFVSGEILQGPELAAAFPGVPALLSAGVPPATGSGAVGEPGDFEIVGELGVGGMGVVYLARQRSLDRLVALKQLAPAAALRPSSVDRFEKEIAALSRCDHPHVVKILATGRMDGTPYYAMEYVEGADLAEVGRELPTSRDLAEAVARASRKGVATVEGPPEPAPERLGTNAQQLATAFRDAARGLHHLHEHGVVHRDVKPGNLMLTAHDGRIVVMDLGLALLEDSDWSLTRDRSRILGTLRYMAPEQLRGAPYRVDRRADVYSLGAVFYELFTGRAFLDGATEVRLIEQVLREAPAPPKKVNPDLPVDLDTILRKATEKDPRFRYETADALARDLDHWLHGRPITARPPTLRYVTGLALRRHRALAATLAAALAAFLAVTVGFLVALANEREEAMARAAEAERERARAEELAEFMLFDLRDGLESIGRIDLLAKVTRKARDYYAGLMPAERDRDRELRHAQALTSLADVLEAQGALPDALASARAALRIQERLADGASPDPEEAVGIALTTSQVGRLLAAQGDLDGANAAFEDALGRLSRLASDPSASARARQGLLAVRLDIGNLARRRGDLASAGAAFLGALESARELAQAEPGDDGHRRHVLVALTSLGDVHLGQGDRPGALGSYREALAVAEELARADASTPDRRRDVFVCNVKIGDVLKAQGESDAALAHYRAGAAVVEELVRKDPTNTHWQRDLFLTHEILGDVLYARGSAELALEERRAALAIAETLARHDRTNVLWQGDLASSHQRLGELFFAIGNLAGALDAYRKALEVRTLLVERAPTDTRWRREVATTLGHLGEVQLVSGTLDDAADSFRKALDLRAALAEEDPANAAWRHDLALGRSALGEVETARERFEAALELHRSAAAMLAELVEMDPTNYGWQRSLAVEHGKVGDALLAVRRVDAAEEAHRSALLILEALVARDPKNAAWRRDLSICHDALAGLYEVTGDYQGALVHRRSATENHRLLVAQAPHFEEELRYLEGRLGGVELLAGERAPAGPEDHLALAMAHYDRKQYSQAASSFAAALAEERLRADLGRSVLYNAACAAARVQGAEARSWQEKALAWLREDFERRRARLQALEAEAGSSPEARRAADMAREALLEHIQWARTEDPDLAALRGLPEFPGLFAESGSR